ncbi:MAG: hypothetical protein J1D88_02485 [Treponema sp.]|nr:hypothetical protein [Treponema sp.]
MEDYVKRIISALCALCIFSATAFALSAPHFSGYTGILGTITNSNEDTDFAPDFRAEGFFAGQFDFGGKFLARTELYVKTDNILDDSLFNDTNATFRVKELSFTYRLDSYMVSHFFNFFLGNYEPIGSDLFLQRQFGIQSTTSHIMESWNGIAGATIYPLYGIGGAYVLRAEEPLAFGLYAFANKADEQNNITTDNILNIDLRFACAYSNFALDISAGLAFPQESQIAETGQDVVLLIRTEKLHAGLTMLLGNKYSNSLFFQFGFTDMDLNPSSNGATDFSAKKIYLFIEPRFSLPLCTLAVSLFSLPGTSVQDMLYLADQGSDEKTLKNRSTLGLALTASTERFYIGNVNIGLGVHFIAAFRDRNFKDLIDSPSTIMDWTRDIYLTPFVSIPVGGGAIKASFTVNASEFGDNWRAAFRGTLGYRTQI